MNNNRFLYRWCVVIVPGLFCSFLGFSFKPLVAAGFARPGQVRRAVGPWLSRRYRICQPSQSDIFYYSFALVYPADIFRITPAA